MDLNNFLQSKNFNIITWILLGIIILLLVFKLGMDVGFKKAEFSHRWGENYYRNFAGPAERFPKNMMGPDDFMDAHGVFGQIIKIDNSALIIKDRNDMEKIVSINEKTIIRNFDKNITQEELKIDNHVVVIGEPDESGKIISRLIRILPLPPEMKK
ncbi:MAG: hypothetical protein WC427_02500 [Candidatus Paceibacterota bacterium]|jgi:hypothetical protein